jgi:DNA-binding beta-propeller fold protein YncE
MSRHSGLSLLLFCLLHSFSLIFSSLPKLPQSFIQENKDSKISHEDYWHTTSPPVSSRQLTEGDVGDVTTFAGATLSSGSINGIGTNSKFNQPFRISISSDGVFALVADSITHLIRHIVITTAFVTILAGLAGSSGSTNGIGTIARFKNPLGICISPDGVYALVAEHDNNLIRQINISTASVTTFAGSSLGTLNGIGTTARFNKPVGITISPDGLYALVADHFADLIRHIIISTVSVTTFAGSSTGSTDGIGSNSQFNKPYGVSISPDGVYALVADRDNHLIRHMIISTASVTTVAGVALSTGSTNGVGTNANFNGPRDITISPDGVYALIGDTLNNLVRKIIISTSTVTTFAGSLTSGATNGIGTNSRFKLPHGVPISPDGVYALIADRDNHLIRKIMTGGLTISPPSVAPSVVPSASPSVSPTSLPSVPPITRFSFGVKIGDEGILGPGKAMLVEYLQDARRGQPLPPSLLSLSVMI